MRLERQAVGGGLEDETQRARLRNIGQYGRTVTVRGGGRGRRPMTGADTDNRGRSMVMLAVAMATGSRRSGSTAKNVGP